MTSRMHPLRNLSLAWMASLAQAALAAPPTSSTQEPPIQRLILAAPASSASPAWSCQKLKLKLGLDTSVACREASHAIEAIALLTDASSAATNASHQQATQTRIVLAPGVHRLQKSLNLTWQPTHPQDQLIIEGLPGETTMLNGAETVKTHITPVEILKQVGIPTSAFPHVYTAVLPSTIPTENSSSRVQKLGFAKPPQVLPADFFYQDRRLEATVWPESGFASIAPASCKIDDQHLKVMNGEISFTSRSNLQNSFVRGFFNWDWAEEHIPILGVSADHPTRISLSEKPQFGMKCGAGRLQLVNLPETLNAPGYRYFDRQQRVVYFWPPGPLPATPPTLDIAVAEGLMRIHHSRNVLVRHLSFQRTRGDAIIVSDSQDVMFRELQVQDIGNRGLIIQTSKNAGIADSTFNAIGEGAIVLDGGHRQQLIPGGLYAHNNHLVRYDHLVGSYRPAILIHGVGNEATRNVISEGQHAGIIFSGNDHKILGNDISRVGLSTQDVGAIYTGRDWTGRGHRIEANYIHNLPRETSANVRKTFGVTAIYLDDQASGIHITNNVIEHAFRGVLVGGGRDNLVRQNIFVDVIVPVSLDQRGLEWQQSATQSPSGPLMQNLKRVPYDSPRYLQAYPGLRDALDTPGQPRRNVVEFNAYDHMAQQAVGADRVDGFAIEANFILAPLSPRRRHGPTAEEANNCRSALRERLNASLVATEPHPPPAQNWPLPPTLEAPGRCPASALLQ